MTILTMNVAAVPTGDVPEMYMRNEDGTLRPIPAEDAAVLERYRDSMPLVWEIQECGAPWLYALIDVDEDPEDVEPAGHLERSAASVYRQLQAERRDPSKSGPHVIRLIEEAVAYHLEGEYVDAVEMRRNGPVSGPSTWPAAEKATRKALRRLVRELEKVVDITIDNQRWMYRDVEEANAKGAVPFTPKGSEAAA